MTVRFPHRTLAGAGAVVAATTLLLLLASMPLWLGAQRTGSDAPSRNSVAAQEMPAVDWAYLPLLWSDTSRGKAPEAEQSPPPPASSNPWDLAVLEERDLLLVGDMEHGLRVFDAANPRSLRELSRLPMWRSGASPGVAEASYLAAGGNLAYVVFDAYGLAVVDISDPSKPKQIGSHVASAPTTFEDLLLVPQWQRLFLRSFGYALEALDIGTPSEPVPSQSFSGNRRCPGIGFLESLYVHQDTVYAVHSCEIDVLTRDRESGVITRRTVDHQLPTASDAALATDLGRLYVVGASGGLEVFDLATPDQPRSLRTFNPLEWRFNTLDLGPSGRGIARVSHLDAERSNLYAVDLAALDDLRVAEPLELDGWSKIIRDVRIQGDTAFLVAEPYRASREIYAFTGLDALRLAQAARFR